MRIFESGGLMTPGSGVVRRRLGASSSSLLRVRSSILAFNIPVFAA
jgi:hypothetical protein